MSYELTNAAQLAQVQTALAISPKVLDLKRSIAAAAGQNARHYTQPWNPPPAYVANAVYVGGQRVVNSGNIYIVGTAGTAGALSAPTGTGMGPITDGTVVWFYIGPTYSADVLAPTYSTSATAPASPKTFYRNSTGSFVSGAANVISNDGWFSYVGSLSAPGSAGFSNFVNALASGLEFETDDLSITIVQNNAAGSYAPLISVDDRYLVDSVVPQASTSGQTYTTITFPSRKVRRIGIRWQGQSVSTSILGVYCSSVGSVWAPPKKSGALRGMYVGDSLSTNTATAEVIDRGIAGTMFDGLGCNDFFVDGMGGTGFVAGSPSNYGSATRLGYIATYNPNLLVVQGSVNDVGSSQSAITAAINAWYASVRASIGQNALIIATGQMNIGTPETATESYYRLAWSALQTTDPNLFYIPVTGDPAGGWFTGTGNTSSPAGAGNADLYWSNNGPHPMSRGYEYAGKRLALAIAKTITG